MVGNTSVEPSKKKKRCTQNRARHKPTRRLKEKMEDGNYPPGERISLQGGGQERGNKKGGEARSATKSKGEG